MSGATLGGLAYELLDWLERPGCPLCGLIEQVVARYFERVSYDSVNDLAMRDELRRSLGYCGVHGQEWLRLQDALGTALIYLDVLTNVRRSMAPFLAADEPREKGSSGAGRLLGRLRGAESAPGAAAAAALEPSAPCPACRYASTMDHDAAGAFAAGLANARFAALYAAHQSGLCLPHLRGVLRQIADPAIAWRVLRMQEACLERTCAGLAEVIRKNDYRFDQEEKGPEAEAPARAVEQAAGRLSTQLNPSKS